MNCPQSLTRKMRLSYILMGDPESDDFKTVALYLTYRAIEQLPNVTLAQLSTHLSSFGLKPEVVDRSVAMLAGAHTVGEGCISVWKRPKSGIQHINLSKKKKPAFQDWLEAALESIPALAEADSSFRRRIWVAPEPAPQRQGGFAHTPTHLYHHGTVA